MAHKGAISPYRMKEDLLEGNDATRYGFESAYSELFREVHWENVVGSIQPVNEYPTVTPLRWTSQREYTSPATLIDAFRRDATRYYSTGGQSKCSPRSLCQPSTSTVPPNSTDNIPQRAAPFEFDPNLVVPFATSYAQPPHPCHSPWLPSVIQTPPSWMMNGHQQTPRAVQFDLDDTSTPPSSHTHFGQRLGSSVPGLRKKGTTLRRRGPDANSINKCRKNFMAEGRNRLFFCEEQGCKNYGFTTRGSLKRHVKDKHNGTEYLCPTCLHPFADSTSIGRHLRKVGCKKDHMSSK